jgi:protein Mpv17
VTAELKEKKGEEKSSKKDLDVKNTLIKFAIDQTVGAAFNIPLFLAIIGSCRGQSTDQILSAIQNVSFPIHKSMGLWAYEQ